MRLKRGLTHGRNVARIYALWPRMAENSAEGGGPHQEAFLEQCLRKDPRHSRATRLFHLDAPDCGKILFNAAFARNLFCRENIDRKITMEIGANNSRWRRERLGARTCNWTGSIDRVNLERAINSDSIHKLVRSKSMTSRLTSKRDRPNHGWSIREIRRRSFTGRGRRMRELLQGVHLEWAGTQRGQTETEMNARPEIGNTCSDPLENKSTTPLGPQKERERRFFRQKPLWLATCSYFHGTP